MKFQKMELISAGTDFDVIRQAVSRSGGLLDDLFLVIGKRSLLVISTRLQESRVLGSS